MARLSLLNKAVKSYDPDLVAERDDYGRTVIRRKARRIEYYDFMDGVLGVSKEIKQFIMALTTDWHLTGQPVEWGIEPVICRLKAMDMWNRPDFMYEFEKEHDRAEESKERDFSNNVEAFLKDFRRQFARTFNDTRTALMTKDDKRRLKGA